MGKVKTKKGKIRVNFCVDQLLAGFKVLPGFDENHLASNLFFTQFPNKFGRRWKLKKKNSLVPSQYAINVYVVIPFSNRARWTRIHSVR